MKCIHPLPLPPLSPSYFSGRIRAICLFYLFHHQNSRTTCNKLFAKLFWLRLFHFLLFFSELLHPFRSFSIIVLATESTCVLSTNNYYLHRTIYYGLLQCCMGVFFGIKYPYRNTINGLQLAQRTQNAGKINKPISGKL